MNKTHPVTRHTEAARSKPAKQRTRELARKLIARKRRSRALMRIAAMSAAAAVTTLACFIE